MSESKGAQEARNAWDSEPRSIKVENGNEELKLPDINHGRLGNFLEESESINPSVLESDGAELEAVRRKFSEIKTQQSILNRSRKAEKSSEVEVIYKEKP